MDTIKTMFTPLMKEDRMKHIDYKKPKKSLRNFLESLFLRTFNSIQQVNNSETEVRYNFLQGKVAEAVRKQFFLDALKDNSISGFNLPISTWWLETPLG